MDISLMYVHFIIKIPLTKTQDSVMEASLMLSSKKIHGFTPIPLPSTEAIRSPVATSQT